MGADCF
jgi:hypothetical protein